MERGSFLILSYTINFRGKTSHYLSGPSQDLLEYLKKRSRRVVFLEQPDPVSEDLTPKAAVYEKGEKVRELAFPMFWFPLKTGRREIASNPFLYVLFKLRDFLSVYYFLLRLRCKFDAAVAVESPNAVNAVFLRWFRRVRTVIYDMIDYSPDRFANPVLNKLFHGLDRWAVYHADFVWNQTEIVARERLSRGYKADKCAPQLVKPTGILTEKIKQLPLKEINRHQIIYMGSFLKRDGVAVLIDAFVETAREIPEAKLVLIGEGELKEKLEQKVKEAGAASRCEFLGVIEDESRLESLLLHSAVGVAPYSDEAGTVKSFNDVSKPKVYLSCGLPVVITQVPRVAEEIGERGAGIATGYSAGALKEAFVKLLREGPFFEQCRQNALAMAKDHSWDQIFDRLMEPVREKTGIKK